jgi:hypothetical protein
MNGFFERLRLRSVRLRNSTLGVLVLGSLLLAGCQDHPGKWDQARIESYLAEKYNLTLIELSDDAPGSFSGRGEGDEGEVFRISVRQLPDRKRIEYEMQGNHGSVLDGSLEMP